MKLLTKIDQFGVPFKLRINNQSKQFQSLLGAIATIILYGLCLAYIIYMFVIWGQGSILPRTASSQKTTDNLNLTIPDNEISFNFTIIGINIPIFSQFNNIITPILTIYENGQPVNSIALFSNNKNINIPSSTFKKTLNEELSIMLILTPCNSSQNLGQTCADGILLQITIFLESIVNAFALEFAAQLHLGITIKQFDASQNRYETISKVTIQGVEAANILYNQIKLSTQVLLHDTGILFEDISTNTYISDATFTSQIVSQKSINKIIQDFNPIFVNLFRIDEIQTITIVTDVKLGELLADIQSIISIVLTLQILFAYLNESQLENEMIEQIKIMICPTYKYVKLNKDYFGRIKEVLHDGKQQNLKIFQFHNSQLRRQSQVYLNIQQIINKIIQIEKRVNISQENNIYQRKTFSELLEISNQDDYSESLQNNNSLNQDSIWHSQNLQIIANHTNQDLKTTQLNQIICVDSIN